MLLAARWSATITLALTGLAAPALATPRMFVVDGAGRVGEPGRVHASMQRLPPGAVPLDVRQPHGDPDALRYLFAGDSADLPSRVTLLSYDAGGTPIGSLGGVALQSAPCPPLARGVEACAVTPPIRAVIDEVDARHPLVAGRSVIAKLGGGIELQAAGKTLGMVRVAGPRRTSLGAIERYRGKLRFVLVRLSPGGALPTGGSVAHAKAVARAAADQTNDLWGACGISFGPPGEQRIEIVDPPPPHLLSLGCASGLPSSGGTVQLQIDGRALRVPIAAGLTPARAGRRVAAALRRAGLDVSVSDNPRIAAGAFGSTDLSVRRANGSLATLSLPADGTLFDDASMRACIGYVNLDDGLQHFGDVDATVGTLEERTLIKAIDDYDATTIEVVMIPGFGRGGRIGESFIGSDKGSIRNVVIVDCAAVRAGKASFTLPHELGHVLLDDPGHPDDYAVDTPTQLMDADAASGGAFGPRRISLAECASAIRQSGPKAAVPLLESWPLTPLPKVVP